MTQPLFSQAIITEVLEQPNIAMQRAKLMELAAADNAPITNRRADRIVRHWRHYYQVKDRRPYLCISAEAWERIMSHATDGDKLTALIDECKAAGMKAPTMASLNRLYQKTLEEKQGNE